MERFRRSGSFLGFRVRCHFGIDQVLWAPGFRGPYLGGCRPRRLEEGGGVGVWGGGAGWFGDEGVLVLICPSNGVASLGVAVWGLCLRLLDG